MQISLYLRLRASASAKIVVHYAYSFGGRPHPPVRNNRERLDEFGFRVDAFATPRTASTPLEAPNMKHSFLISTT